MLSLKHPKLLILCFLVSCTSQVSTDLECETLPESFKEENNGPEIVTYEWWDIFEDPLLSSLEQKALSQSPTLDRAYAIILEARARYGRSYADLWPNIIFAPTDFQQDSLQPLFPLGTTSRQHLRQYTLPVDLSWEVDLFGKLQYLTESEYNNLQAQKAAFWATRLTLTSDVALTYFDLRANIRLKKVLFDTLNIRKEALEINQARYNAGLVNFTDVSRAEVEYTRALTEYRRVDESIIRDTNRLAFLTGDYASIFDIQANPILDNPPSVAAGYPSELLLNRPDLIEQYFLLKAQGDRVKSAKANLFPTFIITGALGLYSPDSSELFSWRARLWEWQAQMTQTLFDFGRKIDTIDETKAQFMSQVADYQETVLRAVQEVEDALSQKRLSALELVSIRETIVAAQTTADLSRERYLKGLVNYLDVVDAERDLLQSQADEVQTVLQEYTALINLVKAIGGRL